MQILGVELLSYNRVSVYSTWDTIFGATPSVVIRFLQTGILCVLENR